MRLSRVQVMRFRDAPRGVPLVRRRRSIGFDLDPHININLDPAQIAGSVAGLASTAIAGAIGATPAGAELMAAIGAWTAANIEAHPHDWIAALAQEAQVIAYLEGYNWSGVELTAFVQAIQGHPDAPALWNALKADWDHAMTRLKAAEGVLDGNYRLAWNLATDNGALAADYFGHFPKGQAPPQPAPDPAFDIATLGRKVNAHQVDARDASDQAYAHGYYAQGNAWRDKARSELAFSPAGAVVAAGVAKASRNPHRVAELVAELRAAAKDPGVIAYWRLHGWGKPPGNVGAEFTPLADDLERQMMAAAALALKNKIAANFAAYDKSRPRPTPSLMPAVRASGPARTAGMSSGLVLGLAGAGAAALAAVLYLVTRKKKNPRRRAA